MVQLHSGILLGYKKEEKSCLVTAWIDLESIMLSEIRQSGKDKYHLGSHLYVKSNEQNKDKQYEQRHGYMEQTDSCQRGDGRQGLDKRR